VVGLPGNPTSALTNASLFVAPLVRALGGLPPPAATVVRAPLAAAVHGEADRYLFLPARLEGGRALPTFKGSGALTSLAASDGWIGVPEGASLAVDDPVDVTLW
jgi:molybdopterin biosynthesis enzyme